MTEFSSNELPGLPMKYLLDEGIQKLRGSDTARLDTELLLCKILQLDRIQIYSQSGFEIPADKIRTFRLLLDKRIAGIPVAYLIGHKEFWSLDLYVNEHTLVPRPETECLVETVLTHVPENTNYSILDLGTGSGAIAIALASERPDCKITAIDTCEGALAIAKLNAERHGLDQIHFKQSNWFTCIQDTFDIIVSNPPYISSGDKLLLRGDIVHEPSLALDGGHDGLDDIRTIIGRSVIHFNTGGWLFIEHGYNQGHSVRELFRQHGYTGVKTCPDYAGLDRFTLGKINNNQCAN